MTPRALLATLLIGLSLNRASGQFDMANLAQLFGGSGADISKMFDMSQLSSLFDLSKIFGNFGDLSKAFDFQRLLGTNADPIGGLPLQGLTKLGASRTNPISAFNLLNPSVSGLANNPLTQSASKGAIEGGLSGLANNFGNIGLESRAQFDADMKKCHKDKEDALRPLKKALKSMGFGFPFADEILKGVTEPLDAQYKELTNCDKADWTKNMQTFDKFLNSQLGSPLEKLRVNPKRVAKGDRFTTLFNRMGTVQSKGSLSNFGDFLKLDAQSLCKKATDEEFRECAAKARQFCQLNSKIREITKLLRSNRGNILSFITVKAEADKLIQEMKDIRDGNTRMRSSKNNCACIASTLKRTATSGNNRAHKCLGDTMTRLESGAKSGAAEGAAENVVRGALDNPNQALLDPASTRGATMNFLSRQRTGRKVSSILPTSSGAFSQLVPPAAPSGLFPKASGGLPTFAKLLSG